jgi:ABC-type multidrug transport system ATPase subunit
MLVELQRVGRAFGSIRALTDIDLAFPSGSRTALIGPNGSGKSTLIRAVLGLIRHEGQIRFDGALRDGEPQDIARRIAYVPQVAPRLGASVLELVRAICRLRGRPVEAVAERALRLGLDFDAVARRPLRALSGGMRQKTLAALALASEASLLVLDEPTASMDPRSRRAFFASIDELPPTTTVLLCSHRLDEIRSLVDRVAVLAEGRLRFCGPSEEFLRRRSTSLVELRARPSADPLCAALGFRQGATGWWARTVPTAERAELVRRVSHRLGDQLVDLLAQDLEDLGEAPADLANLPHDIAEDRPTEAAS